MMDYSAGRGEMWEVRKEREGEREREVSERRWREKVKRKEGDGTSPVRVSRAGPWIGLLITIRYTYWYYGGYYGYRELLICYWIYWMSIWHAMLCYAILCYIRCNIPCSIRTHRVPSHSPMAATATLLSSGFTTSRVCQLRAPTSTKSTSQPWSSHPWSCWSWYRLSDGIKNCCLRLSPEAYVSQWSTNLLQ